MRSEYDPDVKPVARRLFDLVIAVLAGVAVTAGVKLSLRRDGKEVWGVDAAGKVALADPEARV